MGRTVVCRRLTDVLMTSVEVFISDETSARVINTSVSTTDNSPSLDSVDNQTTQSNVTLRLLF